MIDFDKSWVDALPYDFEAAVESHIEALNAHRVSGGPAPHSYAEVEASIMRVQHPIEDEKPDDFVADYRIIDDTPPPPTLAERKAEDILKSRALEASEIEAIMPAGRLRLLQMEAQRLMRNAPAIPTAEQKIVLDEWQAYQNQVEQIMYDGAVREAAIEDRTA